MTKRSTVRPIRTYLAISVLALATMITATNNRNVTEPTIPPACTTLTAHLAATATGVDPADETKLDTARIQKAIDHCSKGHAVALRPQGDKNAFLSGPIELRQGVTLLIDKNTTLYASRDPKLYEISSGSCGVVNYQRSGCRPFITVDHADDSAIMGDGAIDGRGGSKLLGQNLTWWDLAEQARPPGSGRQQVPRLIVANYSDNFILYRITLKNSPNFHVSYNHGDGFTVWGVKIDTPQRLEYQPHGIARNTDGIDPGASKNITIIHSYIRTGDDNIAIKGGPGGVTNMTVIHNHFYWGHGMSIGSETNGGVSKIRVTDLSLDGPDNAIRIKSNASRGGLVQDVVYDDICIRNSPNPIIFSTAYTEAGSMQGNLLPVFRDITLRNVRISGGGKISFDGYDHTHRAAATLDNVLVTDDSHYTYSLDHADITLGPGPVNLDLPTGTDSAIHGTPSKGTPQSCADKFVPFPTQ